MAGATESLEQKCVSFGSNDWFINTYSGRTKSYYFCMIFGQLVNDQETVTTDTSANTKSNEEVTMIIYDHAHTVKFIPNSLFETFVNLESLHIASNNKFKTIKKEYFRNAKKLKTLEIYQNYIRQIDGNVFSGAENLEHISLNQNLIDSVHRRAFSGLPNLKGIYLFANKIKNLHPHTFSSIANLNILELSSVGNCVNEAFTSANQIFPEIEEKISSRCNYEPFPDEVIVEDENLIGNLTAEAQANEEKFKELNNKLEEMKAKLANQQKESDAKIASEKLQMEAKITQMEANLSGQMMLLQNNYLALVDRINGLQNCCLQTVPGTLTHLEKNNGE